MEIWQMRQIIQNVYTTYSWKIKVCKMPPQQVIAVYMSFKKRGLIE